MAPTRPGPRRPGAGRRWFERAGGRPLTWGLAAAMVAAIVLIAVMVAPRGLLPDRVADDLTQAELITTAEALTAGGAQ